ncbi:SusC/RagA family TonB-linked outer membrane protein [Cryomorpha ignava]|uniref:SusC/RagA family TonB-linked outer membrane protein n=1 Tax=Cryomorpha ignava TaxID=101383 RepID=A0A7K3WQC8_9FLAO|nr:SusC/RagA family TonB-linked outer membrane protein [Cryomorpha ignava]NEN23756.1 SusC/RagA family TonB-linked outer membrane protein [Cryomorpha ignava]
MIKVYTKSCALIFAFTILCISAYSQNITGTVYDENGATLPGVTVRIQGTTKGDATDLEGKFNIQNAPVGEQTLVYSFIGYLEATSVINVPASGAVVSDKNMEVDSKMLQEYVVVGYGVQRKQELTGSISRVDGKQITDIPAPSFEAALQGKAAGVQVTQGSGLAGSASVVRIRGIASISASGDPLYVVDGIPITQDYFLNGNRGAMNNNPLATINPNDIEDIQVLKDAAATGIYGSRGANGVILVTTKTGSGKGWSFDFNTRIGVSVPTERPNMLNSEELLQIYQEAWENDGNVGLAPLRGARTWEQARNTDTDWVDETIHTGFKQSYNLGANYGSKRLKVFSSIGYDDNGSYLIGNSYVRSSFRANASYEISKKVTVSASTSFSQGVNNRVDAAWSGGLGDAMSTALPYFPIFYEDTVFSGTDILHLPGDYFVDGSNPVRKRELQEWRTTEFRSINNLSLVYKPIDKLFVKVYAGYDYMNLKDDKFLDAQYRNVTRLDTLNSLAERWENTTNNYNVNATATYFHDITEDHKLTYLVGGEYQQSETVANPRRFRQDEFVEGTFYDNNNLLDQILIPGVPFADRPLVDSIPAIAGYESDDDNNTLEKYNFISAFARINYAYKNKYYAQASFRTDGSSRFGENKRFGFFPSASVGWVLTEETFMTNIKNVSFLKLRSGWGITGNAAIPNYQQYGLAQTASNGYNNEDFRYLSVAANPNLQWETSSTVDFGIEAGFFEDRITTSLSFYHKSTTNVLLNITPQVSTGFQGFWDNVGEIKNQGIEFQVTSVNFSKKNFTWKTDFNIAYNYNEIVSIGSYSPDAISGGTNDTRVVVGKPVGTNFLVQFSHIDPETGRNVYLDINGNETMEWDPANRIAVGRVLPKAIGGITNTFVIGNWNIGLVLVYSLGSNIYDSSAKRQLGVVSEWNMRTDIFDRWRQPGDEADYAQVSLLNENYGLDDAFNNNTTQFLKDGDYLRVRRLSVGYNFPKFKMGAAQFQGASVTLSAVNFLTFTNFDGLDPEIARDFENATDRNMSPNISYLTPPQEMSFNLALNLRF